MYDSGEAFAYVGGKIIGMDGQGTWKAKRNGNGLAGIQLACRDAEKVLRGYFGPVEPLAHFRYVQIHFQDTLFAPEKFYEHRPPGFHDFAQALVDLGVENAIYLVDSRYAYGWFIDTAGEKTSFGEDIHRYKNENYIVWKALSPAR